MGINAGRVQGAGLFHTMESSGTSVNLSSIQPNTIKPRKGDAVQFSNGDVRQVLQDISGSTVALGPVLFSYKGDPGIGGATLSNIDGDSTENGFTQAAVKGIAQAKNYYNLGEFDTYVSNSDGTGTVTRKTGYINLGQLTWILTEGHDAVYYADVETGLPENGGIRNDMKSNKYAYVPSSSVFNIVNSYTYNNSSVSSNPMRMFINTGSNISPNGIVQYELASKYQYAEQVIENQPVHIANQEECLYWNDEWEKGLNYSKVKEIATGGMATLVENLLAGTYTFSLNDSSPVVNGRYILYLGENETSPIATPDPYTFTIKQPTTIKLFVNLVGGTTSIMLNEGTHPYPYEPYTGAIIHENRVPLYMTIDSTSPAQTLGGNWESKGSFATSDGATIYVWRKL